MQIKKLFFLGILLLCLGCTQCTTKPLKGDFSGITRDSNFLNLPLLNLSEIQKPSHSFGSAKIIFEVCTQENCQYLAAQKRAHRKRSKKNKLFEFPGGRVDPGELPMTALLRELAEEDDSGILKQTLETELAQLNHARYSVKTLKNGTSHLLVVTPLSPKDWQKIEAFYASYEGRNREIRRFVLVDLQKLKSRDSSFWTPKSRRLIKGL